MTGQGFTITACTATTRTGIKSLSAGVAFVPQPLAAGILDVPLFYSALSTTCDLLPEEWNRLLSQHLAQPI